MEDTTRCTIAIAASGEFVGWVYEGDDINAAVAQYRAGGGSGKSPIRIIEGVMLADKAPAGAEVLYRDTDSKQPLVAYRPR